MSPSGEPVRQEAFSSILSAAQAGGEWAFTLLYRQHNPALVRYLRANAGVDGDDLASQTWIDIARNLSTFEGDRDSFAGWAFTIARRRLIDHRRRSGRRKEDPADDQVLAEIRAEDDPGQTTVDVLAGDDAARRVVEILPSGQAEIVLLRVLGGLSVGEVAEITGRRPGTVRVMQHRAIRRLADELGTSDLAPGFGDSDLEDAALDENSVERCNAGATGGDGDNDA